MPIGTRWSDFIETLPNPPAAAAWATQDELDAVLRTGTGAPEGVVTAPVGTRYTDTDATRGAVEWVKATGAGNTGWRVVYGDTGWRNITADLANGYTATRVAIRRQGNQATLVIEGLSVPASPAAGLLTLPTGFVAATADTTQFRPLLHTTAAAIARLFINASAVQIGSMTAGQTLYGHVTFPTLSAWPATLPGVASGNNT